MQTNRKMYHHANVITKLGLSCELWLNPLQGFGEVKYHT